MEIGVVHYAGNSTSGGKVGKLSLLFKGSWKDFLANHRVNGKEPTVAIHFRAIAALYETASLRDELRARWSRQIESIGGPSSSIFGDPIEERLLPFAERIARTLSWADDVWKPFSDAAQAAGLPWSRMEQEASESSVSLPPIEKIRLWIEATIRILSHSTKELRRVAINQQLASWKDLLLMHYGNSDPGHVVFELRTAIETFDPILFSLARRRLVDISSLARRMARRNELLQLLETAAPAWALAIRSRSTPHQAGSSPGADVSSAWKFRQLSEQLGSRHKVSADHLQRELMNIRDELYKVSAQYVEARAWRAQSERTGLRQRQALVGWLDLQRKIGKGTGKRVPRLQVEARALLIESKDAVPVWIMPTSRVYESFDPSRSQFDVLILDEASQCDVTDIALFALAKSVVVVGDHEQVSPHAVGQEIFSMQALIDEILEGVPNAVQYDPRTSVYHLARQSFGETIRLVEHFRCVPDIIAFSNALSYSGEIRPLREAASAKVRPSTISHRVQNGSVQGKVNRAEVDEVTALILAADENTAYENLTFGVISMVGIEQAIQIDTNLRRHMAPDRYSARRILCGNPAQFQGDERDVMFISMVDSAAESNGPLRLRNDDNWRKAFNVAVSRAKDQLWVVHSLAPESDLKNDDLRKRLISHAENPSATKEQIANIEHRSESEFERLVGRGLTEAGFRVQMQWEVGAFRIDMVIHDRHANRIAIECDGDRWHPPEKHGDDLARQFVLERLGWRFVRIRGSEFFKNKATTLERVIQRIKDLGVEPDLHHEVSQGFSDPNGAELIRQIVFAAETWKNKIRQEVSVPRSIVDGTQNGPPMIRGRTRRN